MLSKRKKYFETLNSSNTPLKVNQYLLQKVFGEVNSNFFILQLCSTNGQANSLITALEAKIKAWTP